MRRRGQDRNLAETTLADEDYPVLFEIHDRWNMVPPAQRTQDNLRTIVQGGCDQRSASGGLLAGIFCAEYRSEQGNGGAAGARKHRAHEHGNCEMMEHVIALKALALRSAESVDYWKRLAQDTPNVWERHQIVINAFGRWG